MDEPTEVNDALIQAFCNEHLTEAKNLFLGLEKAYYRLLQHHEKIDTQLAMIEKQAEKRGLSIIQGRAVQLRRILQKVRKKRGYEFYDFNRIFQAFERFEKNLPSDFAHSPNNAAMRLIWEKEILHHLPGQSTQKTGQENTYSIVQSSETGFLLPTKTIMWSKKIETKKPRVVVKIKSLPEPNIYSFYNLPKGSPQESPEKIALLLQHTNGEIGGFLIDEYQGKISISEKALKKKVEYFHIGDNRFEPYLTLKGERFYIRNDFTSYR
ncbi:MAG: hypothetical protein ABUK01_16895 [Leptospirales bacterium]